MTDFTIVRRSLTTRLFSTVVTILTVAVAVSLMVVLLSMRDAGARAFDRGSGNMHLLVSREDSPLVSVLNSVFYAAPPRRAIQWSKFEQIRDGFPLAYAIPTQQGDSYRGFPVMATTREFFTHFSPDPGVAPEANGPGEPIWPIRTGRLFEDSFEVVVGATVAEVAGLRPGDRIFLTHGIERPRQLGARDDDMEPHVHDDYAYTVVGILGQTGTPHDRALFTDLPSTWIIHAHDRRLRENPDAETTVEDLRDEDKLITAIYLRVATRPGAGVSGALQQVFYALRADQELTVATPRDEVQRLWAIVSNIDEILVAMAAIVMLSSGVGIMLALYNSMDQRRRQIAVLRVLGASRPRLFGLVLTESAVIGLVGAAVGIALALLGTYIVAAELQARLGLVVDPTLPLREVLLVAAGAVALACAAGVIPAVMAYRTSVSRNLRPIG